MPAAKPSRAADSVAVESRVATIKQRPSSRCFPSVSDVNVSGGSAAGGGASGSTPGAGAILTASGHVPRTGQTRRPARASAGQAGGREPRDRRFPGPWAAAVGEAGLARLTRVASGLQSVYERQGIAVMTPTVPGSPKGPFLGLPRGTMRRQKSIGKKCGRTRRGAPGLRAPRQRPGHPRPRPLKGGPSPTLWTPSPGGFSALQARPPVQPVGAGTRRRQAGSGGSGVGPVSLRPCPTCHGPGSRASPGHSEGGWSGWTSDRLSCACRKPLTFS